LSSTPGASATFVGAVVSYATSVKRSLLSVPQALIDADGVVSAACALQMATGAQTLLGSSYAVSTTGVAGPDRQEGKPVGLVYVAVAGPSTVEVRELNLDGTRTQIRTATVDAALWMLHEIVGASG
jgi:PncC family amidohydrolase